MENTSSALTLTRAFAVMRWVEAATEPTAIARLLAKHGVASGPPPERGPSLPWGQLPLPFR
jgi:hypothetical protein